MTYYILIGLMVALFSTISSKNLNKILYFLIFVLLVLLFGLRGDFTSDYSNYFYLFNYYHDTELSEILSISSVQEFGFVLITKFLSNYVSFQAYLVILGCIIVGCFMYTFEKESIKPWVAVLLFLSFGSYYGSFNVMRQTVASAILFAGSKYLYSRDFRKYLFYVIIATTIHSTAIVMVMFYYLLDIKITKKYIFRIVFFSVIVIIGFKYIIPMIQNYYPRFKSYEIGAYGMTGGTLGYFFAPIVMIIFVLLLYFCGSSNYIEKLNDESYCFLGKNDNYEVIDYTDHRIRIQINALGYSLIISILTTQAFLFFRIIDFFLPHVFILISNMISESNIKENRVIISICLFSLCILYTFISLNGTGYDPYFFFWQK